MDLHPDWRRHRNVGQSHDHHFAVPASLDRDTLAARGMDFCILDHDAAHVVGDDDCDDDAKRHADDPLYARATRYAQGKGQTGRNIVPAAAFAGGYLLAWFGFSALATVSQRGL